MVVLGLRARSLKVRRGIIRMQRNASRHQISWRHECARHLLARPHTGVDFLKLHMYAPGCACAKASLFAKRCLAALSLDFGNFAFLSARSRVCADSLVLVEAFRPDVKFA
eukprot:6202976-Pleurochrysis_carterae.AAC.1